MADVVNRLWGLCHTMRHDGIDYGDYIEQLTYLLFIKMAEEKEIDLAYQFGNNARFRVCVYQHLGQYAAALRLIPQTIKNIDELALPKIFHTFGEYNQGLVLFTGPTGEGKSTSLAAIIDEINHNHSRHIITIEDPVEFVYKPDKSVVSQREVGKDTHQWHLALRSALRSASSISVTAV